MTPRQEYEAAWRKANPDKMRAAQARYKARYPERIAAAHKRWKEGNRAQRNAYRRAYRAKNKEREAAKGRVWFLKERSTQTGHANRMLRLAKKSIKGCSLVLEDIIAAWPSDDCCPVFKVPFAYGVTARQSKNTPSLDRIDSTKGYHRNNVAVISWRANELKRAHSADDLCALADWLRIVTRRCE